MKEILLLMTFVLLSFSLVGCRDDSDSFDENSTLPVASYTITGKVQTAGETPVGLEDVNVTLDGDKTLSTTTDANGNFAFSVPAGEYRITPMQAGITLSPLDHVFEVNGTNVSDINFTVVPMRASPATPNTWEDTGSLTYKRSSHTATLLDDGGVLVAGGRTAAPLNYTRASAELYDPATGKWTTTGSMTYKRSSHTATKLDDGRVLVVGGGDDYSYANASAELYDPATGKWTTTGSMKYERSAHTATKLDDGRVLVVGGASEAKYARASAELYDPNTGKWTTAGSMNYERHDHTATKLDDGRVLVVGGASNLESARASAELYDPTTGKWTTTGSMTDGHYEHTATLLENGKVLVAGGRNKDSSSDGEDACTTAELYDPASGKWAITGSMTYERDSHTATKLDDGNVLVVGGISSNIYTRATAELYNPTTGGWTITSSMTYERGGHTAILLEGRVLVTGGFGQNWISTSTRASSELYYPK